MDARAQARAFLDAGDLSAAIEAYDRVLAEAPTDGEALLNQGIAKHQLGQHLAAIECLERAWRHHPTEPVVALHLGVMLRSAGRLDDALEVLAAAVDLAPEDAAAWQALGSAQRTAGSPAAVESLRRAVRLSPEQPSLLNSLGLALMDAGSLDEALSYFSQSVALAPDYMLGWHNVGQAALRLEDATTAEDAFRRLVSMDPRDGGAQLGLASAHRQQGKLEQAARALEAVPETARDGAWFFERGALRQREARLEAAEQDFERACKRGVPGARTAWVNALRRRAALGEAVAVARAGLDDADGALWAALANALKLQGRADEARDAFAKAIEHRACPHEVHSAALLNLNYLNGEDVSPAVCTAAHEAYGQRLGSAPPRKRASRSRLRVGYLSADLRAHAVSHFIEPVLAHHEIETVGFVDVARPDRTTERLEGHFTRAHRVGDLDDTALAALIEREALDVLVELNGHTGVRLPMLAQRLAPVQLSYVGYPHDTGLPSLDARIGDVHTDPHAHERCDRLPDCFLAFKPDPCAPPIGPRDGEEIVFGSFNNQAKLRPAWLTVWGRLVAGLDGARLLLKNPSLDDAATRDWTLSHLEAGGLQRERVELVGFLADPADHLGLYGRVDIGLDPFPYHGTTTTCEALWMGVPVVSRAGSVHAARVGCSLLHQVGLDDLVVEDAESFVAVAQGLARDRARLKSLRGSLRSTMHASPLCDGARLARALEALYRTRVARL